MSFFIILDTVICLILVVAAFICFDNDNPGIGIIALTACVFPLIGLVSCIDSNNKAYVVTTQYIDSEISYPIEVEVFRGKEKTIKHQIEISNKLYEDLHRIDNNWKIKEQDNNIIVYNNVDKKYYVYYRVLCPIK